MTEPNRDLSLAQARSLIDSYAFDLGRDDIERLLEHWLKFYSASWIRLATIEALYLGRYKAVSIEQIMGGWLRRGTPNPHFNYEFERLICRKLPKHLSDMSDFETDPLKTTTDDRSIPEAEPELVDLTAAETNVTDSEEVVKNSDRIEDRISIMSALGLSYKSNWSEFTEDSQTIHEFIPLPDVSSFFDKLKTFGEQRLESQ